MNRCCKVIVVYFGDRFDVLYRNRVSTNSPVDAPGSLESLRNMIECERHVNPGVDVDIVLVNNIGKPFEEGNEFLRSLDGTPSNRGIFRLLERENVGISFGGYDAAFSKFGTDYDYFFFSEDDVLIFKDGYYGSFLETFNSAEEIGFVGLTMTIGKRCYRKRRGGSRIPAHIGGGVGLTSTENLRKVKRVIGSLPHYVQRREKRREDLDEICFTAVYHVDLGMELAGVPGFSRYPLNYADVRLYEHYRTQIAREAVEGEHVYWIGNGFDLGLISNATQTA